VKYELMGVISVLESGEITLISRYPVSNAAMSHGRRLSTPPEIVSLSGFT
jgi:hypothetical protein